MAPPLASPLLSPLAHRLCVAPMMDCTDRHDRFFLRLMSRRAVLFTEMIHAEAVRRKGSDIIRFHPAEHPVVLQLGGSDPAALADAARIGADQGYDSINLNAGCPSGRVSKGGFGACLMADPDQVTRCVEAMMSAVSVPVSVKCRIGIDRQEPADSLPRFADAVAAAGCRTLIVHARKAWLKGLNPKRNRTIPPLDYGLVHELKRDRPDMEICINGGIDSLTAAREHLTHVDGVMLGRAAYHTPWILADADHLLFGDAAPAISRHQVMARMLPYMEACLTEGVRLHAMTRHISGLFHGMPGAAAFRRHLATHATRPNAGLPVLTDALALIPADA